MKEGSLLLMVSDDPAKIAGAFGTTAEGTPWLPGVMSRKKQVVPNLEAAFKAETRISLIAGKAGKINELPAFKPS